MRASFLLQRLLNDILGSRHACLCNDVRGMQGLVGLSENIVHYHYMSMNKTNLSCISTP